MRKFRPLLAALTALFFYAISDILVWQRIFETNRLIVYADTYHAGWFVSLTGYAMIGVVVMSDSLKDCLYFLTALFIGAYSGLEDVLYYILDGKPMPASLPWLAGNPMIHSTSRTGVISSVSFWLAALLAFYALLFLWKRKPSPLASSPRAPSSN